MATAKSVGGMRMHKCFRIIQQLLESFFTGKIILHVHEGTIKKITKEDMIEKF